jgi:hypothetical protein
MMQFFHKTNAFAQVHRLGDINSYMLFTSKPTFMVQNDRFYSKYGSGFMEFCESGVLRLLGSGKLVFRGSEVLRLWVSGILGY